MQRVNLSALCKDNEYPHQLHFPFDVSEIISLFEQEKRSLIIGPLLEAVTLIGDDESASKYG